MASPLDGYVVQNYATSEATSVCWRSLTHFFFHHHVTIFFPETSPIMALCDLVAAATTLANLTHLCAVFSHCDTPPRPAPHTQCFIHVLWRHHNQHMVPFVLPSTISVQLGATHTIYQRFR